MHYHADTVSDENIKNSIFNNGAHCNRMDKILRYIKGSRNKLTTFAQNFPST